MKRAFASVAAVLGMLCFGAAAEAQSPDVVTVQGAAAPAPPTLIRMTGKVSTPSGAIRSDTVVLVVALYDAQDATTPLWSEEQTVALDAEGRYTVFAGATLTDGVPKEYFTSNAARWIGVGVPGEAEQPRVMLLSVPYALKARDAETLAGKSTADFVMAANLSDSVKETLKAEGVKTNAAGTDVATLGVQTLNFVQKGTGSGVTDSIIFDNGNVGIGTTSPGSKFDVQVPRAAQVSIANLGFSNAASGTGDELSVDFKWWSNLQYFGRISGYVENVANNYAGFKFYTSKTDNSGALSPTPSFTLDGHGNAGIGTATPGATLDVNRSGASMQLRNSTAGGAAAFYLSSLKTGGVVEKYFTIIQKADDASNGALYFRQNSTAANDIMTLQSGGNVGIGTTTPGSLLHLRGASYPTLNIESTTSSGGLLQLTSATNNWQVYNTAGDLRFYSSTAAAGDRLTLSAGGNVGIGTASPTSKLDVAGNINVSGNINAKYQDVAEWVETPTPLEPGTIVIVDPLEPNRVLPSPRAYDTRVAGAVSKQPGLILGERSDTKAMIAQSGRVRVKVDATYGAIRIGDLLVTSPTPGYAMRSKPMKIGGQSLHRPGTLLGKALEALPNGKGEILVLLTLQ